MIIVYAIKSISKNYIYIGMTNNLDRRINEHNQGKGRSTKPYAPFELIYSEECGDRMSARVREKYFKSGVGRVFLRSKL